MKIYLKLFMDLRHTLYDTELSCTLGVFCKSCCLSKIPGVLRVWESIENPGSLRDSIENPGSFESLGAYRKSREFERLYRKSWEFASKLRAKPENPGSFCMSIGSLREF